MNKLRLVAYILIFILQPVSKAVADEVWNCPDGTRAKQAFISGEASKWPNYTEADGARVQRQHPDTAFIAHAKLVDLGEKTFGVCQYYNHIGLTITFGALGMKQAKIKPKAKFYWRKEYTESKAENDKLGQEMMEVCMEKRKGIAYPSIKCSFLLKN